MGGGSLPFLNFGLRLEHLGHLAGSAPRGGREHAEGEGRRPTAKDSTVFFSLRLIPGILFLYFCKKEKHFDLNSIIASEVLFQV